MGSCQIESPRHDDVIAWRVVDIILSTVAMTTRPIFVTIASREKRNHSQCMMDELNGRVRLIMQQTVDELFSLMKPLSAD